MPWAALAAFCILAAGFLLGRAIGDGGSASPDGQIPLRIATRHSAVEVPPLGEAKRIPTLEASGPAVQTTVEEGAVSSSNPSAEAETSEPVPEAAPEQAPEVTVAPNG